MAANGLAWATVLLVLLAGAGVGWALRRRPRQRGSRGVRRGPRHPVVLAHGLLGFDAIQVGARRAEYFRGVPNRLRGMGAEVYTVKVSPSASIATRAQQLAEAVRQIPAARVNIIAHSMGGLDARYAISRLGLAAKVVSLTTVGTPHRGTPIADMGTQLGEKLGLRRLFDAMGVDVNAFYDCTTRKMGDFNREVPDEPGVAYASYVAALKGRLPRGNALLVPAYLYLSQQQGENDGVVPAVSQEWGEVLGKIEADHWAQIGWSRRFDAPGFYATLLRELKGRGF